MAGGAGRARHGPPAPRSDVMRLFIAIDLPEDVRLNLENLERELRPVTSSARWVAPGSIHVTLKFLGETDESRIGDIDRALAGVAAVPMDVVVHGVGFFPGGRSPRV